MSLDPQLIKIGLLCAVATFGIVEAVKPTIKKFAPDSWPRLAVRLTSLAIGAGFGWLLLMDATGALAGCAGAALSSTIVGVVKKVISARGSA